ncbi:hypothetical protein ABZ470_27945 [Streptosporangium sp. NPDC020072]|uniref:hypothetical protein n=1 Tax=Streptosporangium sp. NPDC020072 TaxID=3154788 RepID=UPI003419FC60
MAHHLLRGILSTAVAGELIKKAGVERPVLTVPMDFALADAMPRLGAPGHLWQAMARRVRPYPATEEQDHLF